MGNCSNCDCNYGENKYEYDDNVFTFDFNAFIRKSIINRRMSLLQLLKEEYLAGKRNQRKNQQQLQKIIHFKTDNLNSLGAALQR